jgi:excisionase family DNA binding protein
MTEHVSLSKASKMLGVTSRTLRQWDAAGKLQTIRTVGNHRRIPINEIHRLQGMMTGERNVALAYCRCSTNKQVENLERQVGRVLEYCAKQKWKVELFKEIASGLNDKRQQLHRLMRRLGDADVLCVVAEYKDRIARFGYGMFVSYCERLGVKVVLVEQSEGKDFEQEFAEDIVSLVASYSGRLYGRRGGRKSKCAK